jgi:archaellum component FlaC
MPKAKDKSATPDQLAKGLTGGGVDLDSIGDDIPVTEESNELGLDMSEYMALLDKQVSGSIYDDEPTVDEPVQTQPVDNPAPRKPDISSEVEGIKKDLERLSKSYSDSSREAKKLAEENKDLKQYEEYIPILDEMRRDPDLVQHVSNYLEGNDETEKVATRLGFGDDFIYDEREAMDNPKSDSAKVLKTVVGDVVKENLARERERIRVEVERARMQDSLNRQRDNVAEKYNLSLKDIEELDEFAKDHTLSYDDIYWLKNRDARDQEIARGAVDEVREKSRQMAQTPRSLASKGSGQQLPDNPDEELFKGILKQMGGVQSVFD